MKYAIALQLMATISKDSIAQFWLHVFPSSAENEYLSFSDSAIVQNLLEFASENNEEKKIFAVIKNSLEQAKSSRLLRMVTEKTSPKGRRSTKNPLTNIDPSRLRFTVHIEVLESDEDEVPIPSIETNFEDRTIENLSSILHESDPTIISQRFRTLLHPWLIDLSFQIPNELFTVIVDLMNKHPDEFFLHCFVPWSTNTTIENFHLFYANLYTQLTNISDRCKLCTYLCENSTSPLNNNQLSILSQWFDSKEFYFSNDLSNLLPGKIGISATIFSDNLPFAKFLHKTLLKYTENQSVLTNEQRLMLKQAITINTTILSDLLMDLLD